jgi:hypothetical protein
MLAMDVGVDTHDFRPWHFHDIHAHMQERWSAIVPKHSTQIDEP